MKKEVTGTVVGNFAEFEGKAFVSVEFINRVINGMEAKKEDYINQREVNALEGNWAIVKALKAEEYKLQRDISLIRKLLSNANA